MTSQKRPAYHIKAQKEAKVIDSYMCMICLEVFPYSHGHHLIKYSENGIGSIVNMVTLCPDCHRNYHAGKLKIDIGRF